MTRDAKRELIASGFTVAHNLDSVDRRWKNAGFGGGPVPTAIDRPLGSSLDTPTNHTWLDRLGLLPLANPIFYASASRLSHDKRNFPGIRDSDLEPFKYCRSIRELELGWNTVSDTGMQTISKLHGLERLVLDGTDITDNGLAALASLSKLKHLSLADTAITDDGLSHLSVLTSLEHLNLSGTQITDRGLKLLSPLLDIRSLNLSFTSTGDNIAPTIQDFENLTELQLDGTKSGDVTVFALAGKEIVWLSLDDTEVTDKSMDTLRNLNRLYYFTACDTAISQENQDSIENAIDDREAMESAWSNGK